MFCIIYEKCVEYNLFLKLKALHINLEQSSIQAARQIIGNKRLFFIICIKIYSQKNLKFGFKKMYI